VTADGEPVHQVLDGLCDQTPGVIERVRAKLPNDFPQALAQTIFTGLQNAVDKLRG
jgi:serine/threonine-protein kinase HipA